MRKTLISLAVLLVPCFAVAEPGDELAVQDLQVKTQIQDVLSGTGLSAADADRAFAQLSDLGELHRDLLIKSRGTQLGIEEPSTLGTLAMYRSTVDVQLTELGVGLATREVVRDLFLSYLDVQQQMGELRADQLRSAAAAIQDPSFRRQQ